MLSQQDIMDKYVWCLKMFEDFKSNSATQCFEWWRWSMWTSKIHVHVHCIAEPNHPWNGLKFSLFHAPSVSICSLNEWSCDSKFCWPQDRLCLSCLGGKNLRDLFDNYIMPADRLCFEQKVPDDEHPITLIYSVLVVVNIMFKRF